MNTITDLSIQQLRQIANLKEQIQALEKQILELAGSSENVDAKPGPKAKTKKGGMSAAGRAAVAAAQKARWAKIKAAKPVVKSAPIAKPTKKKFTMSAAAKAKISAAAKARWAKVKGTAKPAVVVKNAAKSVPAAKPAIKKKGGMSAAAKAKLSALAKARWAKVHASGKKKL